MPVNQQFYESSFFKKFAYNVWNTVQSTNLYTIIILYCVPKNATLPIAVKDLSCLFHLTVLISLRRTLLTIAVASTHFDSPTAHSTLPRVLQWFLTFYVIV